MKELRVLGTASRAPTRNRNHNGYLLSWGRLGLLFDPGEGSQRQLVRAGGRSSRISHILLTHDHADHCLGVPGILQRMVVDQRRDPVELIYPAAAATTVEHLLGLAWIEGFEVLKRPLLTEGITTLDLPGEVTLTAAPLDHRVPTLGYRIQDPAQRAFDVTKLEAAGIRGRDVGRLRAEGRLETPVGTVVLDDVSAVRDGRSAAFVMDTRACDSIPVLLDAVDLAIVETTFRDGDEALAERYAHLTTSQAAILAAQAGVGRLVVTHYSARYDDEEGFAEEARVHHPDVVAATDLALIPFPERAR